MSSGVDFGTSVNASPVAGVRFSEYSPFAGVIQWPPMKFSYRGFSSTGLPGSPGAS